MLNNYDNTERDLVKSNSMQENNEKANIINGISTMMEREVVEHERSEPINMRIAKKADTKAPDEEYEYFDKGNLIRVGYINSDIQKHLLTIDSNDVITLCINGWGISLILEQATYNNNGKLFSDVSNVRKTKKGYIFTIRMIYKDALRILKRMGYKKETEHISVNKDGNKVSGYYVSEEWIHEKHNALCDYLVSIVNINKNDE